MKTPLLLTLTSLIVLGAVLAGCSDFISPDDEDDLLDRTVRQNVINGLEDAYETSDIDLLLECFSEGLVFYLEPNTVIADSTLPDHWGTLTEEIVHRSAFDSRSPASSVSLTLTPERDPLEIQGPDPGDPSQWEYYEQYSLSAVINGVEYQLNGYATLTLATEEGDTTAEGDPLWSIIEWSDTGDVPCRVDDITNWTELKLRFGQNAGGYPLRTSPANAVEKLRQSYVAMDALAFADCLADTFRFWLNPDDVNDPGGDLPEYWGLGMESTIAWNMFGPDSNIGSVQLTLTQIGTPVEIPSPGGGESSWQYVYGVDLYVYLPGQWTFWANAASRFTLAVDTDEAGPLGEMLWEITKWEDIDTPASRADDVKWTGIEALHRGRVEESSWGSIKAMYR